MSDKWTFVPCDEVLRHVSYEQANERTKRDAPQCIYEARSKTGNNSAANGNQDAWCRTHGFDCPNGRPQGRSEMNETPHTYPGITQDKKYVGTDEYIAKLKADLARLMAENERLKGEINYFERVADVHHKQREKMKAENERLSAIERRFKAMLPLFEEARDAITAIPLASAMLRGLDLTLAARMDSVGIPEQWKQIDAVNESFKGEQK